MEKILIAAPTAAVKNYCLVDWLMHLNQLKHPDFVLFLAENTQDGGANAEFIRQVASGLPLVYDVICEHIPLADKTDSLNARLALSHELCRQAAIMLKVRHWLHLETDVFPPLGIIENLLSHNKQVVGAMYHRDEGISRKLMVQMNFYRAPNVVFADNARAEDEQFILDGTLKRFAHVGLGCVLIHRSVFSEIPFRHKAGVDSSPDSWFAIDCAKKGIEIFGDTAQLCEHRNQAWGLFGVDFN